MRLLSALVAVAIGSNANADWRDYVPAFLHPAITAKAPADQTPAQIQAPKTTPQPSSSMLVVEIIEAKKRIVAAIEEALTNPVRGETRFSELSAEALNDSFFQIYNEIFNQDITPSPQSASIETRDKLRQLQMVSRYEALVPPETRVQWIRARMTLEEWAAMEVKPKKVEKPTVVTNPLMFLPQSNSGVLQQAVDGFTIALNAELDRNQDKKFQLILLATIANYAFYSDYDVRYSDRANNILTSNNEASTFAGTKISIAVTHLAAMNTPESWTHVLMAYASGNMRIANSSQFTEDFITDLLFKDSTLTPEKTAALNNIRETVKVMEIPNADSYGHHSASSIKERLLETIDRAHAEYKKRCEVKMADTSNVKTHN